jgi:mono/diheme cytochrome c family protein
MPQAGAAAVANDSPVHVTFNRAIDAAALSSGSFVIECPMNFPRDGSISYDAATLTLIFTPAVRLPSEEICTATISAALADVHGRTLAEPFTWHFDTALDVALIEQGRQIFRFDTFGNEAQWTDALRMHDVISAAVDPVTALSVGLKVDLEALPPAVRAGILDGSIDLESPDTTIALLKLDAVVGVKGTVEEFSGEDVLTRVGITCALCHSTVDDSFAPGIGQRLDGWANRDLDPGAIIALSPVLTDEQRAVYSSWGRGMYDPRFNLDGINGPHVITPAYGLKGIHSITSTGDGEDIAYWNRYVAVTQMGGLGSFSEPRTGVMVINGAEDLVSDKLPALQAYQLSLPAPPPPSASFSEEAANRGKAVFEGVAKCASCHSGPELTDANERLHAPGEVVSEPEPDGVPSYASRSATQMYRTAPLRGIWQHPPYFHNGIAATLDDVVELYDSRRALGLTEDEKHDLVEYLKSL